jgi:hypothetical protein
MQTQPASEAIADCRAQLAQVQTRIASTERDVRIAAGFRPSTQRLAAIRLRSLRALEADVLADLARCSAMVA